MARTSRPTDPTWRWRGWAISRLRSRRSDPVRGSPGHRPRSRRTSPAPPRRTGRTPPLWPRSPGCGVGARRSCHEASRSPFTRLSRRSQLDDAKSTGEPAEELVEERLELRGPLEVDHVCDVRENHLARPGDPAGEDVGPLENVVDVGASDD